MFSRSTSIRLCLLSAILIGASAFADDEKTAKQDKSSPLGVRQQRVKRMMQTLERKFQDLAEKLRKTEPEQAEILIKAFQQSQERLIEKRMAEISKLLDATKLGEADTKQDEIMLELDELLRVLLDQTKDWDKVNKEAKKLEQMRKAVQDLLEKQREHLHNTDRLANKDRTLRDMDKQIQDMEKLIEQQAQLEKETGASKSARKEDLNELAKKQKELQKKTEALAKSVGKPSQGDPSGQPKNAKGQKPSNSGGKPAQSGAGECKACLGKAASNQKSAAHKLEKQLPQDARKDEQKAIDDLKKAVDALKQERDRIARLPKRMLDQMAEKQDETTGDAQKLLEEMAESKDSKSKRQPQGQKNVQQAQKSMQQAAEGLRKSDPDSAAKEQEKAVEELKKALDEIEERLAQLREDTLIDRLARLEARFRSMLARQKKITADTAAVHATLASGGKLSRANRLKLRKLAGQEKEIAEQAFQTIDILIEDGTSVVFPRVVKNLQEDLILVAELLNTQRTDDYTQALQEGVEVTLQELIDALQRNLKKKKGGGGGGQCDCEPALLPGSAELKLLRSMQVRVNRRTVAFDKLETDGDNVDATLKKEAANLAELQEEVAEMALELAEKY